MGQVRGDLPQLHTLRSQLLEPSQRGARQLAHDLPQGLLGRLAFYLAIAGGRLGIDVFLKLGMRAQQAQIGRFGRQHQREDNIGEAGQRCEPRAAKQRQQIPAIRKGDFNVLAKSHRRPNSVEI